MFYPVASYFRQHHSSPKEIIMEEQLKSEGRCLYCGQLISQSHISAHLAQHLKEKGKEQAVPATKVFHLKAEAGEMFLHLLVRQSAPMSAIDSFLRHIWLECCGHMSEFRQGRQKIAMNRKIDDVFRHNLKLEYTYDFGSTTTLGLTCLNIYSIAQREEVVLLSRNEPLKLLCAICQKKPATVICPYCNYQEYAFYCSACAKKHAETCDDFVEDEALPVVNSPRMGVCGYTGGDIDKERDGVYREVKQFIG